MVKPTLTTSQQTVEQIEAIQVVVLRKVSKISESVMNKKRDSLQFFPKKWFFKKESEFVKKDMNASQFLLLSPSNITPIDG